MMEQKFVLYGDGIHDDYAAIQEMLDNCRVVYLPQPSNHYLISNTLCIHSNQTLVLPETARIRLADGANVSMLRNANGESGDENIAVIGGVWDLNNMGQSGNFSVKRQEEKNESIYVLSADYASTCDEEGNTRNTFPGDWVWGMILENIDGLSLLNLTFVDPVTYCVAMARCRNFQVENITFDFNDGNPLPANMDGIHLEGGCHNGIIRHLRGTVYDDMVALNADELIRGDIHDIVIDDLYARHAHSAVRLLSSGHTVHNITISNIRGSYFTYCIGFTKYFKMGNGIPGQFKNITIQDCEFTKSDILPWFRSIEYPIFYFQTETEIKGLTLRNIHRTPCGKMTDLFGVEEGSSVSDLMMDNVRGDMALDEQNIKDFLASAK